MWVFSVARLAISSSCRLRMKGNSTSETIRYAEVNATAINASFQLYMSIRTTVAMTITPSMRAATTLWVSAVWIG